MEILYRIFSWAEKVKTHQNLIEKVKTYQKLVEMVETYGFLVKKVKLPRPENE